MLDQITHLFRLRVMLEEKSLRRASEKLNLTQPALSRSLAQLESHFGQPLVERHSRGVKPTPFGERVLRVAMRMERYWAIAADELTGDAMDEKIQLRVGVGPIWRSGILSPVLVEMQRRFPRLVFELTPMVFGTAIDALRNGEIDAVYSGVGPEFGHFGGLVRHKLTEVTNKILAREGHPLFKTVRKDGFVPTELLLDFPWIVYTEFPTYREFTMHAIFERAGHDPEIRMVCQNLLTVLTMLQQSDNLCLLPDLVAIDALSPRLVPVQAKLNLRKVDTGLVYRKEMADWAPIKVLTELSLKRFGVDSIEQ
jgi:DNA-binding transcriptional LysR family regulator